MASAVFRVRLIIAIVAFLGLMVGIDGLLNGPWWRALGGWTWFAAFAYVTVKGPGILVPQRVKEAATAQMADAMTLKRSWPLIVASVLFAVVGLFMAGLCLFAPWEIVVDLFSSKRSDWPGALQALGGEWFARIVMAALGLAAAWAAGRTALVRYRAG